MRYLSLGGEQKPSAMIVLWSGTKPEVPVIKQVFQQSTIFTILISFVKKYFSMSFGFCPEQMCHLQIEIETA